MEPRPAAVVIDGPQGLPWPAEVPDRRTRGQTRGSPVTSPSGPATPHKSYFAGAEKSAVEYLFEADDPTDVRIDVLRKHKVVDTFIEKNQEPFAQQRVTWRGADRSRQGRTETASTSSRSRR